MPHPPPMAPGPSTKTPAWLWAVPVFSCCFLGFLPAVVIAAKTKTRDAGLWAAGFTVATLVGFTLVALQPEDAENLGTRLGTVLFVVAGVGGACYGVVVGRHLDWGNRARPVVHHAPPAPPPYDPNAGAIANVMAARQKRSDARALAQRDPHMARDLRIGRPDLPRHYDDGGLVDVNSASAEVIARWLGLPADQAAHVVTVRQQVGKFERPDDLLNLVSLDLDAYEKTVDRILIL